VDSEAKPPRSPTSSPLGPSASPEDTPLWSPRGLLALIALQEAPLELQLLGRTLLHAALVGLGAGLIGVLFFLGLDLMQHWLLEFPTGFLPLRAVGEHTLTSGAGSPYRPWLLMFVPALGAIAAGWVSRWSPESRGGGGDAAIQAFHEGGGFIRKRVIIIKPIASWLTLGTGGAGGREGPTMQIGGALGSLVGRWLRVTARERRVLMVAGVAAGISAVFRTPLGAALLAIEVLYRDDFESDALIPAVLASVVSYSVAISLLGETTLFGRLPKYNFAPAHLPLYLVLAVLASGAAIAFVGTMKMVKRFSARLPGPEWARPGYGGLVLGILAVGAIWLFDQQSMRIPGQGLGLLGGGYGAVQLALSGASWFPGGWTAVELLALLAIGKMVAASLTIGTGGSAGDFAPSLAIGGLVGGAFGVAASLIFPGAHIQPGAFVLVGMGTFYGGVAHVPLSGLVLVSEMAGSYDLLVPLMLSEGVALLLLRRTSLYHAQVESKKDSPVHQVAPASKVLASTRVIDVLAKGKTFVTFKPDTPVRTVLQAIADNPDQEVFPVVDEGNALKGLVSGDTLRYLASHRDIEAWALAADIMQPPLTLRADTDLRTAILTMNERGVREVPVVDDEGRILGLVDEQDASAALLMTSESRQMRAVTAPPGSR
jgi:CIC family chloride channel protein